MKPEKIVNSKIRIIEMHEQGFPDIIEVKFGNYWFRYINFSSEQNRRLTEYVKNHWDEEVIPHEEETNSDDGWEIISSSDNNRAIVNIEIQEEESSGACLKTAGHNL